MSKCNRQRVLLIPTQVEDVHSVSVSLAIEQLGHAAVRWFGADFPGSQNISINLNGEHSSLKVVGPSLSLDTELDAVDAVWFRRPCAPSKPANAHPDDLKFIERENNKFFSSYWWALCDKANWINPYHSYRRANSKVAQLIAARACGFKTPNTLFTNSHNELRNFYLAHVINTAIKHRLS